MSLEPTIRPRRLRLQPQLRNMLQHVTLNRSDFILPIFVTEGQNIRREIPSMPGIFQMSIDHGLDYLKARADEGFLSYLIFGVIDKSKKDPLGSEALNENNIVCQFLRKANEAKIPMAGITDLCFCEYTSHGHCGPLSADNSTVENDKTVERLTTQAVNHARAGAAMIAPSGMMDGTVGALRKALDESQFQNIPILAYSVKYASAFYGPFRDAADSAPAFGDRHSYQMDPARGSVEALHEVDLDIQQGADMVMVKPAGPYLDIIQQVKSRINVPLVAYQTSGEYSALKAAIQNGWLDPNKAVLESLTAIKRAGADLIITYFSETICNLTAD